MVKLARTLRDHGAGRTLPVILLSNRLTKTLASSLDDGIRCMETSDFSGPPVFFGANRSQTVTKKLVEGLRVIAQTKWLTPMMVHYKALVIGRQLKKVTQFLIDINPQVVVVSGDRNGGIEPIILRAARDLGIVSIITPSAFSASVEGLFIARRKAEGHRVSNKTYFKHLFPNQWRHDALSGEDLSFFGIATTYAYNIHGMLSPNPWVLGGGLSDWILVDSDDVKKRYVALGVEFDKILVTGHPDHDLLATSLNQKNLTRSYIIEKYGLDRTKKVLVLCLPNWAEVGLKSWHWHWLENEFLCSCATQIDCNVLLSLHPSQNRDHYIFLTERYPPLKILDEKLAEVLPAIDVYFTGLSSSTVPWAVLVSVPTVIADHYPEKDHINFGLPGVIHVSQSRDLKNILSQLVNNGDSFEKCEKQLVSTEVYGKLDGKAVERIIEEIFNAQSRTCKENL
jgi:hypothetical protein